LKFGVVPFENRYNLAAMAKETAIKTIERPDGKAKVHIFTRDDGLFRYEAKAEQESDGYEYWGLTASSGLFETVEDAETNAYNEIDWLKRLK
jgi:hypothetical protein